MRKSLQLFVVGFLVFGLIVLNTASLLVPVSAETKTENQQQHLQSYEPTVTENSILSFNFTKDYYAVGETIVATVQVSSPLTGQPSYDGNGAIVTAAVLSKDNLTATVKMQITGLGEENSLTLLLPTATETIQADVFFYTSHSLVFHSQNSQLSAKEAGIYWLKEIGILSEIEYNEIKAEMDALGVVAVGQDVFNYLPPKGRESLQNSIDRISSVEAVNKSNGRQRSIEEDDSPVDTAIGGMLFLKNGTDENGNDKIAPLKNILVEVWDDSAGKEKQLGETYTDENGEYSFWFKNDTSSKENGGNDLFIKISAQIQLCAGALAGKVESYNDGGSICQVSLKSGNIFVNVETGSITYFTAVIDINGGSSKGQANNREDFQGIGVSQALYYGASYAWHMIPNDVGMAVLPAIDISYGTHGVSYYERNKNSNNPEIVESRRIIIKTGYHLIWDPILHEYGHYFADLMGIFEESPGGHYFTTNANFTATVDGLKLAWNEAVATVFAILATDFWGDEMWDIVEGITNQAYDGINEAQKYIFPLEGPISNPPTDYECVGQEIGQTAGGEDCEGAIARVLYNVFDANSESDADDLISFTHWHFWEEVIETEAKTFNEFYSASTISRENFGELLSRNGIAPHTFEIREEDTLYLFWQPGNEFKNGTEATTDNPSKNTNFRVYFYDVNGTHLHTIGRNRPVTSARCRVNIDTTIRNKIANAPGDVFYIRLIAGIEDRIEDSWYLSKAYEFPKTVFQ